MAGFSELIKNFEKIRDYSRDFFVFGYKCRNDYDKKSGRSYDNERRRIESYLSEYIQWESSARGKNLFISADTSDLSHNPLFSLWETKSFTKNDCMLHFCLPDILKENPGSTAQDVAGILSDQYLSRFDDCRTPDVMTIRNKLNEYTDSGIFSAKKEGKTLHYFLSPNFLGQSSIDVRNNLLTAMQFFENTAPAGFLGYFIRRDSINGNDAFSFRHMFMAHCLDDEVLIQISEAITNRRKIRFENCSKRRKNVTSQTVLPLKIVVNVRHGRRFLIAYNSRLSQFFSYRLDNIKNVEVSDPSDIHEEHLAELERRLPYVWGVFLGRREQLEKIELTLHIDEATEDYVLARLKREGKNGTIEKVADNTFVYRNEVYDTMEMVPWLRTFIGRIVSIQGSNEPVISRFINDIKRMVNMYKL